jgi:hypothetical protein
MSSNLLTFPFEGTALMNHQAAVPLSQSYRVMTVTCNFNAAPTTAEDFTITWDNHNGAIFDLLLYTLDPGTTGTSDILWQPDEEIILTGEDALVVQYDNTDARNYGLVITYKAV